MDDDIDKIDDDPFGGFVAVGAPRGESIEFPVCDQLIAHRAPLPIGGSRSNKKIFRHG